MANLYFIEILKNNLNEYIEYIDGHIRLLDNCLSSLNGKSKELERLVMDFGEEVDIIKVLKEVEDDKKKMNELSEDNNKTIRDQLNKKYNEIKDMFYIQKNKGSKLSSDVSKMKEELTDLRKGICPFCKRDFCDPKRQGEMEESIKKHELYHAEIIVSIDELELKMSLLENKIKKTDESIDTIDRILDKITNSNFKLKEYNKIAEYKVRIKQYKKSLNRFIEYKDSKLKIKELCSKFKSLLSRDLRGIVLEDYIRNFEIELNKLSSYLDKRIELKIDKNNIEIYSNGRVYEKLSTGESKRVDIVIQETFKRLHKKRTNLFIYDEIFDGLDVSGIKSVITLLDSIHNAEKDVFTAIISHNPVVHENLEGARLIKIIKENGYSNLVMDI